MSLPAVGELTGLWMVGCGNMGGALLERWLASGLPAERVTVIDPNAAPEGVRHLTAPEGRAPRVVLVAVKPQMFDTLAPVLKPCLGPDTLVISIIAGLRLDRLQQGLGSRRVMRAMPNTPARVGKGVTGLYGDLGEDDRAIAEALASAAGRAIWLDSEDQFDPLTGLSGSGPAYVFAVMEALAAAGEAAGLPAETAAVMARDTVIGAAALADASDEAPAVLRQRVTSPKGTTQAGLDVLREPLNDLMRRTVAAAAARSVELGG